MKLTVFGASGGTGAAVVRQALAEGATVTAVVRDPARLRVPRTAGLDVVTTDLDDPARLTGALHGTNAVISTIGARGRGPTTVCADTIGVITSAMRSSGVPRLLTVSAGGAHTTGDGALVRAVVKPVLQWALRHPYTDLLAMERRVRESGLDWTIIRPARLTDGPRTGKVRSRVDANVRGAFSVSRADLADVLLRAVGDPALVRHTMSVAHA